MRHYFALLSVLTFAAAGPAQQAAPKETVGTPEQLAAHLAQWEREMTAVKTIGGECKRIDVNRVSNSQVELTGEVKCMKRDAGGGQVEKLATLRLTRKDNPNVYERYVCTGDRLYRFSPQEKILFIHKLTGQATDDNFIDFLFQFKAEALKKRYEVTLVRPEDPNYIYFELKPRRDEDKVEFQRARLCLFKTNYLPCYLWFEEPNGNHHQWDLSKVKANDPAVRATDFVAPDKPAGWDVKEVKAAQPEGQPRVVRPNER
jgi:TIGR03009 family protein